MKTRKLRYYRAHLAQRPREERIYKRNHPVASFSPDPLCLVRQYIDTKLDSLCILSKVATRERSMPCNKVIAYKLDMRLLSMSDYNTSRYFDLIAEDFARSLDSLAGQAIANAVPEHNRGHNAGIRSHRYELGTDDHPVALSKSNVIDHMCSMECVLEERPFAWNQEMSLVVPHSLGNLLFLKCAESLYYSGFDDAKALPSRNIGIGSAYIGKLAGASTYANDAMAGKSSAIALRPDALVYNFHVEIDEFIETVRVYYGIVARYPELLARSIFTISGNPAGK